jgi:hypothetical protein
MQVRQQILITLARDAPANQIEFEITRFLERRFGLYWETTEIVQEKKVE